MKFIPAAPFIAYAVLVMVVFVPVFGSGGIISHGDIARSHYFYVSYLRDSVLEGRLPLWNPYIMLGQPFLANPSVVFWYPATLLFFLLPLPAAFAVHLAVHVFFAMAGIYVLTGMAIGELYPDLPRRERMWPSFVAGLVFGFGGYTMAHVFGGNYDVLAAGSWIGWVWAALLNAYKKPGGRPVALLALAVGFQILAGYPTMSVFTLSGAGAFMVSSFVWVRPQRFRTLIRVTAGLILGILSASVVLLPAMELTWHTVRTIPVGYPWYSVGAIPPLRFLQLILPFPFGGPTTYWGDGVGYWEHAMYMGIAAALLALAGILQSPGNRRSFVIRLALFGILIVSVWASVGRFAAVDLYYHLWRTVPVFGILRIPGRFVYLTSAVLAVFSGIGLSAVIRLLPRRWSGALTAIVICVITIELIPYAQGMIVTGPLPERTVDAGLREYLTTRLSAGERISSGKSSLFGEDAPVAYRIPSTQGYDVTMLRDPYVFELGVLGKDIDRYADTDNYSIPYNHPLLRFLSVRYSIGNPDDGVPRAGSLVPENLGNVPTVEGMKTLYRYDGILPLWYLAPDARVFQHDAAVYAALRTGTLPYESAPTFVGALPVLAGPRCNDIDPDAVTMREFLPERVTFSVSSSCSGYLTGSQVYYPGWTATMDGRPVKLYRANLGFMALAVPAGTHDIQLTFRSTYLPLGAFMSLCSFGILIYLLRKKYSSLG